METLIWAPFAAGYAAFLIAVRNYNSKTLEVIKSNENDIKSLSNLVAEFSAYCKIVCQEKYRLVNVHNNIGSILDGEDKQVIIENINNYHEKSLILSERINSNAPDSIFKKKSINMKLDGKLSQEYLNLAGLLTKSLLGIVTSPEQADSVNTNNKDNKNHKKTKNNWSNKKLYSSNSALSILTNSYFILVKSPFIAEATFEQIEKDIIKLEDQRELELAKKTLECSLEQSLLESKGEHVDMFTKIDKELQKKNKAALEVQLIMLNAASEAKTKIYSSGIRKVISRQLIAELFWDAIVLICVIILYTLVK